MHEFSITSQVVQSVLAEAEKQKAKRVLEVHMVVGKLSFLGLEQVRFSYKVLVKGTIMERSKLFIEEKEGQVKCPNCGYEGEISHEDDPSYHNLAIPPITLRCPKCGGTVEIVGGRECLIKSVKIVV